MATKTEIVFQSQQDAERVLEAMVDVVKKYGSASVGDLHEFSGLPSTYADQKNGWKNLEGSTIKSVEKGFTIEFPPVEAI